MNLTDNRSYPYPQCSPPLVKDDADAPVQTRSLAEAMDADFDTVSALITSAYQLPTTILRVTAAVSIASGSAFSFDTVEYDNQGWATDSTITPDTTGVFLLTGFAHSVLLTNVQSLALQFTGNGSGFHLQGTSPPVTSFGRMTASSVTVRADTVTAFGMRPYYSGTSPSDFDNAWLSVTRMVEF
jgi:hypothetical protein